MCLLCLQDLKYKILVKGRKDHLAERCSSDCSSSDEEVGCSEGKPSVKKQDRKVTNSAVPECTSTAVNVFLLNNVTHRWFVWLQPGVSKLSLELSELVVYTCSVPFKGFEQAAARPAVEMSSFSESKALKLIKDSGMTSAWLRLTESNTFSMSETKAGPTSGSRRPNSCGKIV